MSEFKYPSEMESESNSLTTRIWSIFQLFKKFRSLDYWEGRYQYGGNSGSGSYGSLARFKAKVINDFVKKQKIQSVIEFGCGDGNQLAMFDMPRYIGLDVSETAVMLCIDKFQKEKNKSFFLYRSECFRDNAEIFKADLTLSLDVLYHLIEDQVFEKYCSDLFDSSKKWVIIYSSDKQCKEKFQSPHIKHRKFTEWIRKNIKGWQLDKKIENKDKSSPADFYIYRKI